HLRHEPSIEMKVRSTDCRAGDFDDDVGRILNLGIGMRIDAYIVLAVPGDCFHAWNPLHFGPIARMTKCRIHAVITKTSVRAGPHRCCLITSLLTCDMSIPERQTCI